MKLVIVGGVAGGASAAARARRMDEKAEIVILERGEHVSFANCGLPYFVGGEIRDRGSLLVQTPQSLARRFRIDVRTHSDVISIDRAAGKVKVRELQTGREYEETYDKLILAPGASPVVPPIPGADLPGVFTLRNVPDAERIKAWVESRKPASALVVGAGFIGLEMVESLSRLGLKVHLVEMVDQVLPVLDADAASFLKVELQDNGVKLHLGVQATSFELASEGLRVGLSDGSVVEAGLVILSVGVRPETGLAKAAGLELGARGGIRVDDRMRTSDPDIYAVGDAVEVRDLVTGNMELIALAGPANRQGRIAADNAVLGAERIFKGSLGTSVVRVFNLAAAHVGASAKRLARLGIEHRVSWTHSYSHATYYPGAQRMSIKLLFAPSDGRILGAQIVGGEGVDKRIDILATAITAGMSVYDLTELDLAYAPPFGAAKDPVNMSGYAAQNVLEGKVEAAQWDEPAGSGALILDVRTPMEFAAGHLPEALNLPLDDLRENLDTLPRDREILVYCRVGLRGYIGARILSQNGFQARNLSGGIVTWSAATGSGLRV
ncbi:FAD-dependent oxidoreductase [bacterium]|nr:FAD-dependent oxidoreductase [bacterium]